MLSTSLLYCNNIDDHSGTQRPLNGDHQGFDDHSNVANCSHESTSLSSLLLTNQTVGHNHPPHHYHHLHQNDSKSASIIHQKTPSISSSQFAKSSITSSSAIYNARFRPSSLNGAANSRYRVQYLGCNTCDYRTHKPEHGIGTYQKPLLDLYCAVLRRSVMFRSLLAMNQVVDLSSHGIFIADKDRTQNNRRPGSSASATATSKPDDAVSTNTNDTVVTKVITPLSNIRLWAAVRLQHRTQMRKIKNSGIHKRHVGVAFVPLSCSEAVLDKNAFVTLNSKQRFLLGM